jgi:DeoR/GlpR family transcriptional regulator of sugar metabolism
MNLTTSRQEKLLKALAGKEENVSVTELSQLLAVTEATIRTDLNKLMKTGKVVRTHGGARLIEERVRQEYSFQIRKSLNSILKHKIAEIAVGYINSFDSIVFDASTTVMTLTHELRKLENLKDLTVIPTGIWTAIELMSCNNINILLPGGYIRHTTGSIMGLPTNDFLKELNIQKAFLGAWGISTDNGLTDTHLIEIELKKFIVTHAAEVIVLVDGSKFSQSGLSAYAEITQVSKIITDSTAPQEEINKIRSMGVEVIIAN